VKEQDEKNERRPDLFVSDLFEFFIVRCSAKSVARDGKGMEKEAARWSLLSKGMGRNSLLDLYWNTLEMVLEMP
jgi:hypothetical protein